QLIGAVMTPVSEVNLLKHRHGHFHTLLFGYAGINKRERYIFQSRKPGQQIELLENKTNFPVSYFGQVVIYHFTYLMPVQIIISACRRIKTSQYVHERAFAGA